MTQEEYLLLSVIVLSSVSLIVIVALLWTIRLVQKKSVVTKVSDSIMSFELAMEILRTKVTSSQIELRLTYHNETVLLSSKLDEVIAEYTKEILQNISPPHRKALEYYLGKKFMILFIQRNIRETVVNMVLD